MTDTLPPCKYGKRCYRHNPHHYEEYSHPCKHGSGCRRHDALHMILFTHPGDFSDDGDGSGSDSSESYSPAPVSTHTRTRAAGSTKSAPKSAAAKADSSDIDGIVFVFTGAFSYGTRKVVERRTALLGGICHSNVSKNTDYVVVGAVVDPHGNKEDRAKELGVAIIGEDEWDKMLNAAEAAATAPSTTSSSAKPSSAHHAASSPARKRKAESSDDASKAGGRTAGDGDGGEDDASQSHHTKRAKPSTPSAADEEAEGGDKDDKPPPKPLKQLEDGESCDIKSASSSSVYKVKRTGDHYYCTCPAWRNQSAPVDARTCKHLQELLGSDYEKWRVGHVVPMPLKARGTPKPDLLLAYKFDAATHDPTGWHMSEKLDGVRAYWDGKHLLSRLGNPFAAPDWFVDTLPTDTTLDGELYVGRGQFSSTVSIVKTMGSTRWKEVSYMIFDIPSEGAHPFEKRYELIQGWHAKHAAGQAHLKVVEHVKCKGKDHLDEHLEAVIKEGGEGLMLRKPGSKYDAGRSTTLLKVKRFHDAEAEVTGYHPGKGRHKSVVGALKLRMACGKEFKAGSGLSDNDRKHPPAIGSIVTYRFQELTDDGVPRFPTYVGVRVDMTEPKDAVL